MSNKMKQALTGAKQEEIGGNPGWGLDERERPQKEMKLSTAQSTSTTESLHSGGYVHLWSCKVLDVHNVAQP